MMHRNPLHLYLIRMGKTRKYRGEFRLFSCKLKGFVLLEALCALLVLAIAAAMGARFYGSMSDAYADARRCCAATSAACAYRDMVLRQGVPGWYADGGYQVVVKAVTVPAPMGGERMNVLVPDIRFAQVIARGSGEDAPEAALLVCVPHDSTVAL